MLEGDDTRSGAFALFLCPHPGAFRRLMCPHPGEFAHFFKKNANARGLARGGAWAPLELTDALAEWDFVAMFWSIFLVINAKQNQSSCWFSFNSLCEWFFDQFHQKIEVIGQILRWEWEMETPCLGVRSGSLNKTLCTYQCQARGRGGGGRATHGNLTVTHIPRVGILTWHHAFDLSILKSRWEENHLFLLILTIIFCSGVGILIIFLRKGQNSHPMPDPPPPSGLTLIGALVSRHPLDSSLGVDARDCGNETQHCIFSFFA